MGQTSPATADSDKGHRGAAAPHSGSSTGWAQLSYPGPLWPLRNSELDPAIQDPSPLSFQPQHQPPPKTAGGPQQTDLK